MLYSRCMTTKSPGWKGLMTYLTKIPIFCVTTAYQIRWSFRRECPPDPTIELCYSFIAPSKGAFISFNFNMRFTTDHPGSSLWGSSVLSPASPCIHRAGIRCGPWRTGISDGKSFKFPSRSTMYMDENMIRTTSWKAPCSFRLPYRVHPGV